MADTLRGGLAERDIDQAITTLKKGAYLLKYGRRGKPKFCPFKLSNDESTLIWYSGKEEKQLKLSHVSRIIPGQRTAIFQRYPRPEKEYQSFSLIYNERSLDLICKDKDEAEVWFVGLKSLITRGSCCKWRVDTRSESASLDSPNTRTRKDSPSITPFDPEYSQGNQVPFEGTPEIRLGKAFSDIVAYTATAKSWSQEEPVVNHFSSLSATCVENSNGRTSASEAVRFSLSSAVSSSSQGSCQEDFDALGDVFICGEGIGDMHTVGSSSRSKMDALLPKPLESTVVLDIQNIACGSRHAVLVTKQGEIFSWGEESGGRLGHGLDTDVPHPKLIDALSGMNVELVACGEHHTCAVTLSADLYTWGDGIHNSGLLGHGSEVSHCIPKRVTGNMDGMHISYISCGPWHTAAVTSAGQLFTFGDGYFGALGHGDHSSANIPREVEFLRGLRTTRVACGVWHTAAVVEVINQSLDSGPSGVSSSGKLFTWGDGDKGQLGHGDKEPRLFPEFVVALGNENICQAACGHNLTIALTTSGRVYTMGCNALLGSPTADGKVPIRVEGRITNSFVEEIACGSHHAAVLTSKSDVYTWGKNRNGQLGHGDNNDRDSPTLVNFLKDKQVKNVVCGSNFTAIICLHKWVSSDDHSMCSGCRNPFGFRRKRHNCYNCGLVFCKACSSRKSLKASLAPNMNKPYRVCGDCFTKLKKSIESGVVPRIPKVRSGNILHKSNEAADRESLGPRLHVHLSRLSSVDSLNHGEIRHYKQDVQCKLQNSRVFPGPIGKFQLGGFYSSKVSTSLVGTPKKFLSASVPGTKMASRATSPISGKSSPRTSGAMLNDSKHMNDSVTKEIINLRAQVEDLTHKSQCLEAELERTTKQLRDVTAIAADEAGKCNTAKGVIKSLTAQLKEIAEKLPEGHSASSNSGSTTRQATKVQSINSNEIHKKGNIFPESESDRTSMNPMISYGNKAQPEKSERVIQDEPGVYITLSSLAGGGYDLKRVRFSRKHFTEEQAEKWWAEHGTSVCGRHNIRSKD
ncbi:RCC1 domain-containing protein/FYVE domain-containing protein/BRX domain-containing protein/Mcp5_PH domain-containing protein/BRX_N domain-containing protein [Cephalotus follicularis]|uniref:RCC1 domain-containing protein/FYVE domain-containing protein/BRX domain-containing protein/Mcp5_PH domain-containing protein/BRX_N domain-containing protein n=1 Tax=Cephalotus follicularis TaxID=3775 RepID=A0A1Q3B1W5_CEPFO|nr:RCC1 domain-containing protein/FYVE domain-containing protein/BRX domain-containing protein/Mcp5_PH domain-containing protein/BRX_N domain-containing protein [Cephalotus follicularis]